MMGGKMYKFRKKTSIFFLSKVAETHKHTLFVLQTVHMKQEIN